ncbi:hypothetical protein L9F63_013569 [Diploptera punctata]|uniref:Tox-ART-HYD1 domain-containing protein n=1 Tax=Diploptera punctata TaxID=6984 RepID=A0AAD8A9X1_DIPPU|nr:hypothetical protein L9F63_013569 [Diploptera punctata]
MAPQGSKLYHYTTESAYSRMVQSGHIRPSTNITTDAVLGQGVYLTQLPPSECNARIISNNWDNGEDIRKYFINQYMEKVEVCIEFDLKDLPGVKIYSGRRDIAVHRGSINLKQVPHKVHHRSQYERGNNDSGSSDDSCCVVM